MVSFENFVKSMPPSLSELKVTPSFCFPFKIPDDPTALLFILGSCETIRYLLAEELSMANGTPYLLGLKLALSE